MFIEEDLIVSGAISYVLAEGHESASESKNFR